LQIGILLTGNYCFFNLLAIALSLLWLDDFAFKKFCRAGARVEDESAAKRRGSWPRALVATAGVILLLASLSPLIGIFRWPVPRRCALVWMVGAIAQCEWIRIVAWMTKEATGNHH